MKRMFENTTTTINIGELATVSYKSVNCVKISNNGKFIAIGSGGHVMLWEFRGSEPRADLKWQSCVGNYVKTVLFSKDDDCVIYGCSDYTLGRISVDSGTITRSYQKYNKDRMVDMVMLFDGPFGDCFVCFHEQGLVVWGSYFGSEFHEIDYQHLCFSISVNRAATRLAVGCARCIKIYQIKNSAHEPLIDSVLEPLKDVTDAGSTTMSLCFGRGDTLLAVGLSNGTIQIRNAKNDTYSLLRTLRGHTEIIDSVSFLSVSILVSGSRDGTVKSWNIANSSCLHTNTNHESIVNSVDCASNSSRAVIVSCSDEGHMLLSSIFGDDNDTPNKLRKIESASLTDQIADQQVQNQDLEEIDCNLTMPTDEDLALETRQRLEKINDRMYFREPRTKNRHPVVSVVCIGIDMIASCRQDNTITVIRLSPSKVIQTVDVRNVCLCLSLNASQTRLAVGLGIGGVNIGIHKIFEWSSRLRCNGQIQQRWIIACFGCI